MRNHQSNITSGPQLETHILASSKGKHIFESVQCLLVIVILAISIVGVYIWQHNEASSLNARLLSSSSQLSKLREQVLKEDQLATQKQAGTFTYSPETSGISLTLPKTYEVLVNADGNNGGAPGATFKIVPTSATNISADQWGADEVTIEASNTFTGLDHSVSAAESQINQTDSSTNFNVSDATIAGLAARHITLYADEYTGTINTYVVGSGPWEYQITANVPSYTNIPLTDILKAVLNGITIKPTTAL